MSSQEDKNIENQKQYEKDLLLAVENDLKSTFMHCFERDGVKNGYVLLTLKSTRDDIIQNVGENTFERNFIDNNYEKILTKVKKIYENDEKSKEYLEQLKYVEDETEKNNFSWKNFIFNILQHTFSPLGLIVLAIIGFIWGYFYFAVPVIYG